jgi:hypothetical protein
MNQLNHNIFQATRALRNRVGTPHRAFADVGHAGDYKNQIQQQAPAASSSALAGTVIGNPKSPWVATKDPKGGAGLYYWNTETNETTPVGVPKPAHWVEVRSDKGGTSLSYWWNPENNATTAIGAPKPHYGQMMVASQSVGGVGDHQPMTFGGMMKTYVLLGVGVAFGGMAVRAILGF